MDQGENFDSVSCNLCGHNIDIGDWQTAMDKAYEKHFEDLAFNTPCCKNQTGLNDLVYMSPAGFAKFVMTVEDAEHEIKPQDLDELQQVSGTELRLIWANY